MATEHFSDAELRCACPCAGLPPQAFQDRLERFRVHFWGRPMRLTSAYRCPEHNAKVSRTGLTGPHTKGAVDVAVSQADQHAFLTAAFAFGWEGIGIAERQGFVHLDGLGRRIWTY